MRRDNRENSRRKFFCVDQLDTPDAVSSLTTVRFDVASVESRSDRNASYSDRANSPYSRKSVKPCLVKR